ncbi:MFS transporter [Oceanobacillus bengalensis]|uniref:MFS transporter n=1 Tax=Oceanobacillus bengalensis TaxID=1435466 RepID=A0A494Z0T3_9BACI|nr:MFS transporter [Oceanobacillus bengalensis]RKQ15584.1 MFS transporter [Oceanobacillus bengalensis]
MLSIFKNRSFIYIWLGNAISELGGAFGTFCNSLLIYELTGSTFALGSMWLLYFVPSLLLQLFIGPSIDKWSRKWIMIFALWGRGGIFLIPLIGYLAGTLVPWHIYAVQLVVGLITPLYVPANHAILPSIIAKNQLSKANAYVDGTVRLMTFMAPIVAGIVIEYIGVTITLILVCVLLALSGTLLLFIQEERKMQDVRKTWLEQFTEGIHYFFSQKTMVWLGIFLAFVQFGVGVTMVINIPYITDVLGGNYAYYGYFMAGFPLGYVIGTLLVGKITLHSRRVLMLGSLLIGGLTYINLGITHSIVIAISTEIIAGIVMAIFNIHNLTICQQTVPNHLMGKVLSVRLLIIRGMMPLGVLVGGTLSVLWGVRPLYLFIGTVITSVSIIGILLPYFKFIDQPVEIETDTRKKATTK